MGAITLDQIARVADKILELTQAGVKKDIVGAVAKGLELKEIAVLKILRMMGKLSQHKGAESLQRALNGRNTALNLKINEALSAYERTGNSIPKDIDIVRLALETSPGNTPRAIAEELGISETGVWTILTSLTYSRERNDKKLMAKREAYKNGGAEVVAKIKASLKDNPTNPVGATYRKIARTMTKNDSWGQNGTLDETFKRLVKYCKKSGDEELKKIFKKHLEEDGYWPKGLEKPK